jgi:predicted nucleic acid-binding protein
MLFIYWLEDNPQFANRVGDIRSRMQQRQDQLITSTFTFAEIMAGIYRKGSGALAADTKRLLEAATAEVVPFTLEAAERYAQIRGTMGLSAADAIHLSCAAQAGTDLFLTNDKGLVGKFVPGIQFIVSLDSQFI